MSPHQPDSVIVRYTEIARLDDAAVALAGQSDFQIREHVLNNFSLLAANRLTHLKVVMLAFACMTLVVGFGLVHSALARDPGYTCRSNLDDI